MHRGRRRSGLVLAEAAADLGGACARGSDDRPRVAADRVDHRFVRQPFGELGVRLRSGDIVDARLDEGEAAQGDRQCAGRAGCQRGEQQRTYRLPRRLPLGHGRPNAGPRNWLRRRVANAGSLLSLLPSRACSREGGGVSTSSTSPAKRSKRSKPTRARTRGGGGGADLQAPAATCRRNVCGGVGFVGFVTHRLAQDRDLAPACAGETGEAAAASTRI